jgi:predicted dehydrogenase
LAWYADKRMATQQTLRIGIIGCGRVAQMRHLPILRKLRGIHLVAIAERDPVVQSHVGEQFSGARRYQTHTAMLEDPNVEAVLVCTPPQDHHLHARDVLLSGRHLYVDSPLAITAAECDDLVELAGRVDCVATVGLNLRQHSQVQRAHRDIAAGRVGTVQAISSTFTTPSRGLRGDLFPPWRQPASVAGSVFGESAIQHFDIWRLLTGAEFSEVSVQCPVMGGPVSMIASMRHPGDSAVAPVAVGAVFSEYSGNNNEIRVIGSHGTLSLSLYRFNGYSYCAALESQGSAAAHLKAFVESFRCLPQGISNLVQQGEYGTTFLRQLEAFVAACRGDRRGIVSMEDGRAATVATLAAYQSMATGQKVLISQDRA